VIPYGRQSIDDADVEAVVAVLRGDWLTTGPAVEAFEADLARIGGTPGAVAVTSGTAALHVAYRALGVGPGTTVVVPPLTFVATASTALLLGAEVVFADVDERTGVLDPAAAAEALTPTTTVVTTVGYAGHPSDVDALRAAVGSDVAVVEDAAHSIGSTLRGRPVGAAADATAFSFFPTKNLTTAEGGAVVSPREDVLARARSFRNHGLVRDRAQLRWPEEGGWHQEVHEAGLNYRLPDVLCALGISQLRRLDQFARRRAEVHERYREGLSDLDSLLLPAAEPDADPVWHLYPVRVREGRRRALYEHLRAHGVGAQVNYLPVHWHPLFADLGWQRGQFPVAEQWYAEELSLPMHAALTDGEVDHVVEQTRAFLTA
jgi:dTDP-4-amino-4,6-dideoxygalactose transaminase